MKVEKKSLLLDKQKTGASAVLLYNVKPDFKITLLLRKAQEIWRTPGQWPEDFGTFAGSLEEKDF